jgi:hypothetical protein
MAKAKVSTETNVSPMNISNGLFGDMSEDEMRALYEQSQTEVAEKTRTTEVSIEYINAINSVFNLVGNDKEIPVETIALMITKKKQTEENNIATNEGRDPVKLSHKPLTNSLRNFIKQNKTAKSMYTLTEGRNQKVSKLPSY